jgi:tRNA modification GTPase
LADNTIFALSSGAPPAAIGIIRVSGPAAGPALRALLGRLPEPRRATFGWLRAPETGDVLDQALVLWLPGPGTSTGEDIAELHIHGGRAVAAAVLGGLEAIPGLRLAEPGEFTRRAFANGVIDLAQAEGLADLIAAETDIARRNAQQLAGGVLSRRVRDWQERILRVSAEVETMLDFADEQDADALGAEIGGTLGMLRGEMARLLDQPPAERLKDGIRVVLAGPPNAGKSTLLNAIAGREAAIAAPTPGTTRDLIEVPLAIGGMPFLFVDTAGLREEATDAVEGIGIARARAAADAADILVWLGAPSDAPAHPACVLVHPRSDVVGRTVAPSEDVLAVSSVTGLGIDALVGRLRTIAASLLPGNEVALVRRQREALADCHAALVEAGIQCDPLLVAEELRHARSALDRLTGRAGVEQMLDALFSRFCIGK